MINEAFNQGLQNGNYEIIQKFNSYEEAKSELKNRRCTYHKTSTFTNYVWIFSAYYIEEHIDDEVSADGYEFAEIEKN